jgi:hypothetical protein
METPMSSFKRILASALCLIGATTGPALASSHREAPAISDDPAADNTDLWAFVKPGSHDRLYIVAAYNPLEEPSGGPNFHKFSDDVLYQVHLSRGGRSLRDVITYQIRFRTQRVQRVAVDNLGLPPGGGKEFFLQLAAQAGGGFPIQTYTVTKVQDGKETVIARDVRVAPPNVGPRTFSLVTKGQFGSARADYDNGFTKEFVKPMGDASGSEGTVFAGPRDDGFYVDLGGVFDLAGLRPAGVAQDGVAGFNCHAIAFDIPTTKLTADGRPPGNVPGNDTTLGVWASASRRKVRVLRAKGDEDSYGPWVQVSRLGVPLVNEALIGFQDKDKYNRTHPAKDVENFGAYFLNPVLVRDAEFAGFYNAGGPLAGIVPPRDNRTDILDAINLRNIPSPGAHDIPLSATGDVLRVDLATDSAFPNGRPIYGGTNREADVTDILLSLILTRKTSGVSDGVGFNDATYLTETPWLALPWRGSDQGHGKVAAPTPPAEGPKLIGLVAGNRLVTFAAGKPAQTSAPVAITGLATGESIVGITVRPATGALIGLGDSSRLYQIDASTGLATGIGPGPFSPALMGQSFGVDFNPTVDRIRVVSDAQQNLRLHPDLGTVVDGDPATPGVQGDANLNPAGAVSAAAYTNSVAGASTTTLFVIDHGADTLLRQGGPDSMPPSPNTGMLTPIGSLAASTDAPVGFDIAPGSNTAYAVLQVQGTSKLHTIDLGTGAATLVGDVGYGPLRGIAVLP